MEEDLRTGDQSCWWNPKRNSDFGAAAPSSIISCYAATAEIEGRTRARCWEESAGSACNGSSITSQETLKVPSIMPSFSLSPTPMISWTQALLNGGRSESNFVHAVLQEDDDLASRPCIRPDAFPDSDPLSADDMNQHSFGSSYKCPSTLQELLLESEPQRSIYDDDGRAMTKCCYPSPGVAAAGPYQGSPNEPWQTSPWAKFSHHHHSLLDSSLALPKAQHPSSWNTQLQFTNNAPFWNAAAAAAAAPLTDFRSVLCSLTPSQQLVAQPKTDRSNIAAKMNDSPRVQDSCSSSTHKSRSEPPPIKKPRIETPSPLPNFKVRKEKLGDRITALQQLVSPFGKTDTASVLQEAIEYIKFLHDQVGVLSSPYLKNRHPMQQIQVSDKVKDCDELAQDLRSRGLCLVPITSTYPVASETAAEFWHPTFGGTFR